MKAALLLATLALAAPLPLREPAIGTLLIAKPAVGAFFAESVVVLVDHGDHGSLGLIVNRPLRASLAELLPDLEGAKTHREPAWFGGPVAPTQMLLLIRAAKPPQGAVSVIDGVSVSGSEDTLRALLEHPPAGGELRAYVGYAGWAPGQLAAEIARGDWLLAPATPTSIFPTDPATLWQQLLRANTSIEVKAPTPPSPVSVAMPPWHLPRTCARPAVRARN